MREFRVYHTAAKQADTRKHIHLVNSVGSSDAFAACATWKLRPHPLLKNLKLYFQFLYPCIATLKTWRFSNYASAAKAPEEFFNLSILVYGRL